VEDYFKNRSTFAELIGKNQVGVFFGSVVHVHSVAHMHHWTVIAVSHVCCRDDAPSQWRRVIFGPGAPKPSNRFSWNFAHLIISTVRPHTQNTVAAAKETWGGQVY